MSSTEFTLSSQVASQLECAICLGKLVEPKLLTCGHTFCRGCLEDLLVEPEPESFYDPAKDHVPERSLPPCPDDDNDPGIVCPLCRVVTQVSSDGADGLTTNFVLQSLLESLDLNTGELEEPADEEEEENTPKSGDVDDGELTMCELHKEKMKFYCSTCELLICRDCTVVDHPRPDHKCTNLDEAYTWRQQINQKELQLAKKLIKSSKKSRVVLLATVENLNQRCDQVINEIEACRQEGAEMLNSKDAAIKEYQCSLEEHTQHLRDLTQHAKGTTKIDVLDKSKSLVETLSSCREERHVVLNTPGKVQYPMFVGAEEEIQGWPKPPNPSGPNVPKKEPAKSKTKKTSQDKTSEAETDSRKGPNLASGGCLLGTPQAIYPPVPQLFLYQSLVPGEPQRGGGRGNRGGQGHRGGNQGRGGQGQGRGGCGGGRGGQGQGRGGGEGGRGGQGQRSGGGRGGQGQGRGGGGGGRGGQGQRSGGDGGGRWGQGGEYQRGWGGHSGNRGRGGQTGNRGRGTGHQ